MYLIFASLINLSCFSSQYINVVSIHQWFVYTCIFSFISLCLWVSLLSAFYQIPFLWYSVFSVFFVNDVYFILSTFCVVFVYLSLLWKVLASRSCHFKGTYSVWFHLGVAPGLPLLNMHFVDVITSLSYCQTSLVYWLLLPYLRLRVLQWTGNASASRYNYIAHLLKAGWI